MNKLFVLGAGTPTPTEERFGSSIVLSIENEKITKGHQCLQRPT